MGLTGTGRYTNTKDCEGDLRMMSVQTKVQNRGTGSARVEIYDWLRLVATIFVVIGHSAYLRIHTTFGGVAYALPENINAAYYSPVMQFFRYLSRWVYGFHMPLFFMLSGAVLALRPLGRFDAVVQSKIKRLIIPYFVYGWLFMLPVKYIGHFYSRESVLQAMQGLLSGQDAGHLWFLTALFWCLIIFVLIEKITIKLGCDSRYLLLMIAGLIQLTYSYIPFDVLKMKTGLSYIFWFALGFVFEKERQERGLWNIKKTVLAYIILTVIEFSSKRYGILNEFFVILCGSVHTFLLADILSRIFKNITKTKGWKIVTRNLFYIYLFHDPLEYVVLRLFMGHNWLSSALGCYSYTFCRIVVIFFISLIGGELMTHIKKTAGKILAN